MRLYKAKDKVYEIGTKLGLAQYLIDAGKRLYTLAYNKNFIQGRSVPVVAAVCLYAACRSDGRAPYLLIDFSDAI
jgi:transcription factor IIIB subunit 2